MTATVIHTRTPVLHRLLEAALRRARRAWVALQLFAERCALAGDESYIAQCSDDGLMDGLSLRAWRDQCAERRVRIALLERQQRQQS
jgi:hypothetical protein